MTALTQTGTNAALAFGLPVVGVASLVLLPGGATLGALVALTLLWLAAIVVFQTLPRGRLAVGDGPVTEELVPRGVAAPASPAYVVNVGRPRPRGAPVRFLLAPLELLAVAWSVPLLFLALMVPVGLLVTTIVWAVGLVLHQ